MKMTGSGKEKGRIWKIGFVVIGFSRMLCICTQANAHKNYFARSPKTLQRPKAGFRGILLKILFYRAETKECFREKT